MFPIMAIGLLVLVPIFVQAAPPVLGEIATFSELSSYLEVQTNGAVRPVKESFLGFRINHKFIMK